MRFDSRLLGLPASILFFITSAASSAESAQENQSPTPNQWPWNLPKHVKYWPEDPPHRRRDLEAIEENLRQGRTPVGVMKMSTDEGEKFYMEYWQFEGEPKQTIIPSPDIYSRNQEEEAGLLANLSMEAEYRAPFALHAQTGSSNWAQEMKIRSELGSRSAAAALAILEKRGYSCPSGTADCSAIGYPNSCCYTTETCFVIPDTGLGSVGCCPNGSSCGGSISTCNSPNTACADSLGGGCCIPNFVCEGVGCVANSTVVVTTVIITQTFSVSSSSSTQVTTVVSTVSPTTTSSTYTGLQTTLSCSATYTACPVLLGGGCCPTDRVCGTSSCELPSSSTTTTTTTSASSTSESTSATGVAPVRPTSASDTITTTQTSASATGTSCPTGFYACEAFYAGGCCRTGRNCDTTSCPVVSSTTLISSGVTIVVPIGSAATVATPTGSCASGWSSCAVNVGGNCCPSGYDCGTASCSLVSATSTAVVEKESPGAGNANREMLGLSFLVTWAFMIGVMIR